MKTHLGVAWENLGHTELHTIPNLRGFLPNGTNIKAGDYC